MQKEAETTETSAIDGPSVASKNCISSCPSTTGPNASLFVQTSSIWTPLRCLMIIFLKTSGVFPKWQEETPKRQKTRIWCSFGALPPMLEGCQSREPFESEYFLNYGAFFRILGPPPPWQALRACYIPLPIPLPGTCLHKLKITI